MLENRSTREKKFPNNIFYGWWIILAGLVGMTLGVGFNFHALNAFIIPVSETFNVSIAVVATVLSVARIETALIGPLEGYLVDRFGPRTMMFIGLPIMSLGFFLISIAQNITVFIICFLLGVVLGSSLGLGNPISTSVANWWVKKRGRAFGILWLGTSLASIIVPLVNMFIESYGWRNAFRLMGFLVLIVGIPIACVMRHRPEQYGMLPDGEHYSKSSTSEDNTLNDSEISFTMMQAIRLKTFWAFAFSVSIRIGITTAVAINSFPLVVSLGGTATQASMLFLLQGVLSAPGRVFLSWAGDSINKRYIMASSLFVMTISLFFMSQANNFTFLAFCWVPYAVVWGGLSSLPQSLRADLFGRKNFGSIQGAMSPLHSIFSVASPIFAAAIYDNTQSYSGAFLTFSGLALFSMVLILIAKPVK
ncbi:MAG: MFS transporter [SAR202 cluster bacterium]|mgnify:CR=1 FL=1|nr:MFS transporter [SAR202 cluster bacterium]|tara:strand:- start:3521 stop:4780 length:1260 start_codon:yes stop_codon:yes gene_type:complete